MIKPSTPSMTLSTRVAPPEGARGGAGPNQPRHIARARRGCAIGRAVGAPKRAVGVPRPLRSLARLRQGLGPDAGTPRGVRRAVLRIVGDTSAPHTAGSFRAAVRVRARPPLARGGGEEGGGGAGSAP